MMVVLVKNFLIVNKKPKSKETIIKIARNLESLCPIFILDKQMMIITYSRA